MVIPFHYSLLVFRHPAESVHTQDAKSEQNVV